MPNLNKKYIVIFFSIIIFVIASILRLWQLGKIPVSMADDETRLAYSAYSISRTGRDLYGHLMPLTFVISGYAFNPVPIYFTSLFVGAFGLSMNSSRLPFALTGIMTVILVYAIAVLLSKSKAVALFSSGVLAFSVWHLTVSRFAYEGGISLFLFLLGVYFFLKVSGTKHYYLPAALVCFVLGFFSYSAYKITFVPVILALVWYKYRELNLKQFAMITFSVFFSFGLLFYLGKTGGALKYGGNLFFFQDKAAVEMAVELERRVSEAPGKLKQIYHNKLTYVWDIFIHRYEYALSPQYLFSDQEGSGIFSLRGRGQMYYIDAALIMLGITYLIIKKRKEFILMIIFIAIAPLPSGLGPEPVNYTLRSSFMLPWLAIFAGSGLYAIWFFVGNKYYRGIIYFIVAILYLYFVGGYLTQYYFDWNRLGAKYYSKADQDLALFLLNGKNDKQNILVANAHEVTILQFAFYAKLPPRLVQGKLNSRSNIFSGITFTDKCPSVSGFDRLEFSGYSLIVVPDSCVEDKKSNLKNIKPGEIIKSSDGGNEWYVYAGKV